MYYIVSLSISHGEKIPTVQKEETLTEAKALFHETIADTIRTEDIDYCAIYLFNEYSGYVEDPYIYNAIKDYIPFDLMSIHITNKSEEFKYYPNWNTYENEFFVTVANDIQNEETVSSIVVIVTHDGVKVNSYSVNK